MVITMKIELAKSAGFCFGVSRAVDLINSLLEQNVKVCTLGPVIHNPQVVRGLEERGALIIASPQDAPEGSVVVIRSHGVAKCVYDDLSSRGQSFTDATCPYVSKIHNIVSGTINAGATVLIAGDPTHPEVEGIKGHCQGKVYVFNDIVWLKKLTEENPQLKTERVIVVAQTTFDTDEWDICNEFVKKVYTNAIVFDTICSATSIRQQEAKELAAHSDIMIIVGSRHSSNTQKLYAICSRLCASYHVEGADELPLDRIKKASLIGVTAGASTPAFIIKEVLNAMSGLDNIEEEDFDFATALEMSFKTLSTDERVIGVVASVSSNEVQVDLGIKYAGFIPANEMTDDPLIKLDQMVKVGDEIELVVLRVNDQDGTVMLSKKKVDAIKSWDDIVKAADDGSIIEGIVTDVIKGGVLVAVHGLKVFVPASQSGVARNDSLDALLKKPIKMKIIEVDTGRRRAVGSIRALQKDERKILSDKFWSDIEVGRDFTGKVKSLTVYGAFIDLGGVDGMVHISELSWSKIKHPSEVLTVGDNVRVYVKDLNTETKKVSLGYRDKGENPWTTFIGKFNVGDIVDAKIVNFMPFGSFAQIIPGIDGLIHISQISEKRVAKPQDVLTLGEIVKAKIIEINEEKKRISLSMTEAAGGQINEDELGENHAAEGEQIVAPEADELGENV
jgi:(E)-4-hydroxy-3-methyl-but-2-enyl pyrophosphate reductase